MGGFIWEIKNGPFKWDKERKIEQSLRLLDSESLKDVSSNIIYHVVEA